MFDVFIMGGLGRRSDIPCGSPKSRVGRVSSLDSIRVDDGFGSQLDYGLGRFRTING